jgi:hypothetical protein
VPGSRKAFVVGLCTHEDLPWQQWAGFRQTRGGVDKEVVDFNDFLSKGTNEWMFGGKAFQWAAV